MGDEPAFDALLMKKPGDDRGIEEAKAIYSEQKDTLLKLIGEPDTMGIVGVLIKRAEGGIAVGGFQMMEFEYLTGGEIRSTLEGACEQLLAIHARLSKGTQQVINRMKEEAP